MPQFNFGWIGIIGIVLYLAVLLGIAVYRGRGVDSDDMSDYYLGGLKIGPLVLFFTLYATQFSGNTAVGYAAVAYRQGWWWMLSIPYFLTIYVTYTVFGPRLQVLANLRGYITPSDWAEDRFDWNMIGLATSILFAYACANYLLEQLVAMGHMVGGITAGYIPYQVGVVALLIIMLVYEWWGGLKSVATADTVNGIALMIGILATLIMAIVFFGGPIASAEYALQNAPDILGAPSTSASINWLSFLFLTGIGAAVYPQAIQRIYAAEDEEALKSGITGMAWAPYITSGFVFLIGLIGIGVIPGLGTMQSEEIVPMLMNRISSFGAIPKIFMILMGAGIIGAIMSTADSVLLTFESILSKDLYGSYINPEASEAKQVKFGKIVGTISLFILLIVAWEAPATLMQIFVFKFEMLIHVAPVFLLGLFWSKLSRNATMAGLIVGVIVSIALKIMYGNVFGIHAGIVGLGVNFAICIVGSIISPATARMQERMKSLTTIPNEEKEKEKIKAMK